MALSKQWAVKCYRIGGFFYIVYHILQQPLPNNTEKVFVIKARPKMLQLLNVVRVNFQNKDIVTKKVSPASIWQTWNTSVLRPPHEHENETYSYRIHVDTMSIACVFWEVALLSNKARRSTHLFHFFDIWNSFDLSNNIPSLNSTLT